MKKLRLTLADEEGTLLESWEIGGRIEFDIEDLEHEPNCDFYVFDGQADSDEIGRAVISSAQEALRRE